MTSGRTKRRLEAIEVVLEGLRERDAHTAILVEGDRDVRALGDLGVPGPIVKLNAGESLLNMCESLARRYDAIVLLTDWDTKGEQLAMRLRANLERTAVRVDTLPRERLGRLVRPEVSAVEALAPLVERLRRAVGTEARRV